MDYKDIQFMDYLTIYDYYDQPLSFTFELNDKFYYARLIDYEEETRTDVFWVNEVDKESIKRYEEGKLSLYDLMTGIEDNQPIYIFTSQDLADREPITRLTIQQALEKYAQMLPDKDRVLDKDDIYYRKENI